MKILKTLKKASKWVLIIAFGLVIILYLTDYNYILKGVRVVYLTGHITAFIDDYTYFENEDIPASTLPQPWPIHENYNSVVATEALSEVNKKLGTIAFLIIKNDSIWFENYAENYSKDSQTNSFSMAKSITSALLGKAIHDGFINSLEQPVSDFYPQFANSGMTVGDLSSMASGLNWDESYKSPFSVTARSYYDNDLAETILNLKVVDTPGKHYKYLSGNTELLGMVIQKAIQKPLAKYLSESFWQPMGAENPALWQVDDKVNRLVKSYCCIASNARDFARFGKLYKDNGKWNRQRLLDSSFVATSVYPRFEESPQYGYGFWLSDYLEKKIFVMRGILGQYVITIPEDNLIIVRLGHNRGDKTGTPFTSDFYTYVEEVYNMLPD
ncbi:serine hydrolase domain-containing protein [Ulvibacter antarcticus]|uniref:CubicO group peptidase (Beta-lactamase class C family) n=1 Tax=Ulvibacter antarcticus TaxID=442714 RepID=A0A3L9YYX2_9FLAO|nr:serine hydrolase [Ulvibacter antarcticus]RMA65921.1 CubicO group peptidase (beta-lactamase class C family) [Ulvibacter antarcticus]